jgi:hypothetical protein
MPTVEKLRIAPDRFEVNGATFSSTKRYIRETSATGYAITSGVTIACNYYFESANTEYCYFAFNIPNIRFVNAVGATPNEPPLVTPTPVVKTVTL